MAGYKDAARFDTATALPIRTFEGLADNVKAVALSPDGRPLLIGSFDGTARLWDVTVGREVRQLRGHTNWIMSVAFSPDGKQVVTASYDGSHSGHRHWTDSSGSKGPYS